MNRTRGHNFERDIVNRLKEVGWIASTARYTSRALDDSGVDIAGDFPFKIQCKATLTTPGIHDILTTTDAEVIFWRKIVKKGKQFYADGEYAMLPMEDYLDMVNKLHNKTKSK